MSHTEYNIICLLILFPSFLPLCPERQALIQEAITEAKQGQNARKEKVQTASNGRSSAKYSKYMSKEARRQGEARQLLENMVHKAERKLAELQRKSHAENQSAEARAEELASELFHQPGSMLTEDEISHMMVESDCVPRVVPQCYTPTVANYRTINGVCNNMQNPFLGAADIALSRIIPSQYEDGISALRGGMQSKGGSILSVGPFQPPNPSPRHISQTVIHDSSRDEALTHMLMQWGQFIDHDMSLTPDLAKEIDEEGRMCKDRAARCEFTDMCKPIPVRDIDPVFGIGTPNNGKCIAFSRSSAVCADPNRPQVKRGIEDRQQINVLTSFIDGSMIYGSDEELARRLRRFNGGLLREGDSQLGKKPELPRITPAQNKRANGEEFVGCPKNLTFCFLAGDARVNEHTALIVMHTLFLREHNRIARELAKINPFWKDEQLYQEARKIVGAIIQKITYNDYLHLILGSEVHSIVIGPYEGYDPLINPGITNAFSTAAYRYGHSLIRTFFDRLGSNYQPINAGPLNLLDAFFNPDKFRNSYGTDSLLRGLITQNSHAVDEFMSSILTNHLFRDQLDLAALNLQRGRDHGLPPYLTWKRYCKAAFPSLGTSEIENKFTLSRLLQLYGSLDTLDLWIGGLAEKRRGSMLGATFACLFGITFSNIRDGDRFYYLRPGVFKPDQLASIQHHTLASIICDNSDGIDKIQRYVFLSGQPRVSCSQIPRINLNLWKEEQCYFRVNVHPRRFVMALRTYSRVDMYNPQYAFSIFDNSVPIVHDYYPACVPTLCPKTGQTMDIIFSTYPLGTHTGISIDSNIPANLMSDSGQYHGKWPEYIFGGTGTGVFRSRAKCELPNSAFAFTTYTYANNQEELDPKMLELLQQQGEDSQQGEDKMPNPYSPETDEQIPNSLIDILFGGFNFNGTIAVQSETPSVTNDNFEEESDAQLMSDLEDALKSLNV